jgi:hypothetical protein
MPDREQRVREIAHRLWEEEGRPHDQDKRHWAAAERMVDAEAAAKPTAAGKRRTERKAGKRTTASPHTSVTQTH